MLQSHPPSFSTTSGWHQCSSPLHFTFPHQVFWAGSWRSPAGLYEGLHFAVLESLGLQVSMPTAWGHPRSYRGLPLLKTGAPSLPCSHRCGDTHCGPRGSVEGAESSCCEIVHFRLWLVKLEVLLCVPIPLVNEVPTALHLRHSVS